VPITETTLALIARIYAREQIKLDRLFLGRIQDSVPYRLARHARVIAPTVVCLSILFMLFGQFLIGPPNVHSARTFALIVETVVLVGWLLSSPQALLWRNSHLFRWILSIWLTVGFVGVFFASYNSASALVGQLEWMSHLFFIVALVDLHSRKLLTPLDLFKGVTWAGVVFLAFFLYRWNIMDDPQGYNWSWGAIPFINIRHVAYFILPAFVCSLYVSLISDGWLRKVHIAFAICLLAFLIWTGGRASVAAAILTLIFVCVYLISIERFRKQLAILVVLGVVASFALTLPFSVDDPALSLFSPSGEVTETNSDFDDFSSGRLGTWQAQLASMSVADMWIGQGVDNYKFIPDRADISIHPHSWFMQAWSSWGIVVTGLIIIGILVIIASLIRRMLSSEKLDVKRDNFFLLSVLSSSLALSLLDGNLYNSWSVTTFAAFFASAIYASSPTIGSLSKADEKRPLRSWWLYGTSVLVVALAIHLINNMTVFGRSVPKPSDWRASIVMAIPYNTVTVESWLDVWQREDQGDMLRLLSWLQANSPQRHRFMLIEADMLDAAGYEEEALQKLNDAIEVAPKKARKALLEFKDGLTDD